MVTQCAEIASAGADEGRRGEEVTGTSRPLRGSRRHERRSWPRAPIDCLCNGRALVSAGLLVAGAAAGADGPPGPPTPLMDWSCQHSQRGASWTTGPSCPPGRSEVVALAANGDLYLVDPGWDHVLRRLPSGKFEVVAGEPPVAVPPSPGESAPRLPGGCSR